MYNTPKIDDVVTTKMVHLNKNKYILKTNWLILKIHEHKKTLSSGVNST